MARGSYKLTLDIQEKICAAIGAGSYVETAAAFAGISRSTLYEWLRLGADQARRRKRGSYRRFAEAVQQALARCEVRCITTIVSASRANWQAAAWRLERMSPERWGRRDHVSVDMGVRRELEQSLTRLEQALPAEEYQRVLRVLADPAEPGSEPAAEDREQVH